MREYKFRAWIKNEEIMIDESDFYDYTIVSNGNGFGIVHDGNWLNKADFIIMQYTGLKDKNGVEIYEGDIVIPQNINDNAPYVIKWRSDLFMIVGEGPDWMCLDEFIGCEVIGNIHQHQWQKE